MTNYDEIVAGRKMDALVAEKVFGWRRVSDGEPYFWPTKQQVDDITKKYPDVLAVDYLPCPTFSTSVPYALQVISHIGTLLFSRRQRFLDELRSPKRRVIDGSTNTVEFMTWWFFMANKPLEICLAALKSVSEKEIE